MNQDYIEKRTCGAICVIGRGIERASTNSGDVWKPTRYIETPSEFGHHLAVRSNDANLNDNFSVIAGSNANVIAAYELFREFRQRNNPPQLIIFAAGRPPYLSTEPDLSLSEGKIMSERFQRKLRGDKGETKIVILDQNRNTRDDIVESLSLVHQKRISHIGFVTVAVHIPRATEFLRLIREDMPRYQGIEAFFVASEEILMRRYYRSNKVQRIIDDCIVSQAYNRTVEREKKGIQALRSGTYKYTNY